MHPELKDSLLKICDGSCTFLLTIIDDILDLSKTEVGHLEINATIFNLRQTIEDVLSIIELQARIKGIEMRHVISEEVPVRIKSD